MSTAMRMAAFAAILLGMLAAGAATGAAVGPDQPGGEEHAESPSAPLGGGVVAAAAGYRLVPGAAQVPAGGADYRFGVTGPDGVRVTTFSDVHERALHLIVVNRELSSYFHLHPELAADGMWSVPLPALGPGSYRVIADFKVTGGPALALGVDLAVGGDYRPVPLPAPSTTYQSDGYDVSLAVEPAGEDHGGAGGANGSDGQLIAALTVSRGGVRVDDLQPYLGASGHLVALRAGDLAYAHVHPLSHSAGTVKFAVTLTAAGPHRLFFDFRHGDVVRTASFTVDPVATAVVGGHTDAGH